MINQEEIHQMFHSCIILTSNSNKCAPPNGRSYVVTWVYGDVQSRLAFAVNEHVIELEDKALIY